MMRVRTAAAAAFLVVALGTPAAQRSGAAFTLSPNRPYAPELGKLHFHNPVIIETGGALEYENRASFDALTPAQNSRYLRLGLKTETGGAYKIACAVKSAGAGTFEVVGPGLVLKPALSTTLITFQHKAQLSHWAWFTIAATAPWTFQLCTITKLG